MPKQKLLATLLHISNLHIGSIDPNAGDATLSPAVQIGLDNFPLFDGLLGHRAKALRELAEFVRLAIAIARCHAGTAQRP